MSRQAYTENIRTFYDGVGRRVRGARKDVGSTQDDVARDIGISRPALVNIEKGQQGIPLHTAVKLAARLGVSLEALIPWEVTVKPRRRVLPTVHRVVGNGQETGRG